VDQAVDKALAMQQAGAGMIDVGGASSRPGANVVPADVECARVVPVIKALRRQSTIPISIDTNRSEVAMDALAAGADMVNDISGLSEDSAMVEVIHKAQCPVCIMHMKGTPGTMQNNPHYQEVVDEVCVWLKGQADRAIAQGMDPQQILLDPGIGFGKTVEHNIALIRNLETIKRLGYPVLVGVSRKSFIHHLLAVSDPAMRLGGSLSAQLFCARRGADIIRTHDVRETVQALAMESILEESHEIL